MRTKHHKCLSLSNETLDNLQTLKELLNCPSDSDVITKLITDKVAELNSGAVSEDSEKLTSLLKVLVKICRGTEERSYVLYEAMNNYLKYLGDDELPEFSSSDTDLNLSNRSNRTKYYEQAHSNYSIKIKKSQQHDSNI